ncbi:MAG: hypothetical protein Q9215_001487 [Flavoplaca cf. flavocitrina]
MPRTNFPPTPASSMDITGKDGESQVLPKDKNTFVLPPPAIAPAPTAEASNGDAASHKAAEYSLPPPPTRTRKIIQMTPKTQPTDDTADSSFDNVSIKTRSSGIPPLSAKSKTATKKQPSSTSQAGKRIARKTAHSVIERRRRSKMNEEFGVLKDMIPACKDQDMHKLAILQASIDYLRYLEQCVGDLKAANGAGLTSTPAVQKSPKPFQQFTPPEYQAPEEDDEDDDEGTDVEMTGTPVLPPLSTIHLDHAPVYSSSRSTITSPALTALQHQNTVSHPSSLSSLPSPNVGPPMSANFGLYRQHTSSASTSPALMPVSSKEADEEATTALMMLNKDRRNTSSSNHSSSGRGMSVRDLLSS